MPRGARGRTGVVVGLLLSTLAACSGQACTLIGAEEGLFLDLPGGWWSRTETVRVRLCDAGGCDEVVRPPGPLPRHRPVVGFDELSLDVGAGPLEVVVALRDASDVAFARRAGTLLVEEVFPNGPACGGGVLQGTVRLRPTDGL